MSKSRGLSHRAFTKTTRKTLSSLARFGGSETAGMSGFPSELGSLGVALQTHLVTIIFVSQPINQNRRVAPIDPSSRSIT